jgi:DNA-directed RNA polymerase subunit RPC12/RpoP
MLILFYSRALYNEETPVLHGIGEDGKVRRLKFPHILKSTKRNSFFLLPGTIWDCSFRDSDKVIVPNEYTLHASPIDANPDYTDLSMLAEFLKPLEKLWRTGNYKHYYQWYVPLLSRWIELSNNEKKILVTAALLSYCQKEGLFPSEYECVKCHNKQVYLHHELGILCPACDSEYKNMSTVPVSVLQNIEQLNHNQWSAISDETYRKIKDLLSNLIIQTR